jgi:hypothetical protein
MKVISVNAGLPRTVHWKGKAVSTGIFKTPVSGRIRLWTLNFDGDVEAWGVPADRVHTEAFGPATIKLSVRGPTTQPDCGLDGTAMQGSTSSP